MCIDCEGERGGLFVPNSALPPVRNTTAESNNLTSVTLSWMQDPDTQCNNLARLAHITINYGDKKRLRPDIDIVARERQTFFEYTLTGLAPGVNYSISIHVSTNDGRRSTPAIVIFETSEHYASLC